MIVDDLRTGLAQNVPAGVPHLNADVTEVAATHFHPDVVVHAAASYKDPTAYEEDARVNVMGACAVLKAFPRVERIIYFQTSLCYGLTVPRVPLPENWPLEPHGSYAVTKTCAEQLLLQNGRTLSFRLANMYGPRNLSGPLPAFAKRIAAGEECVIVADSRRDFIYIRDAVDLFVRAIDGEGSPGIYHVSTGRDFPIQTIFELAAIAYGEVAPPYRRVPRAEDDAPTILLDPTHTKRTFAWEPETRLDEGVALACQWYQANGVAHAHTHLSGAVR